MNVRAKAPEGYAIAIASVGVNGINGLASSARALVFATPNVVGAALPPGIRTAEGIEQEIRAPGAFTFERPLVADALVYGGCGVENTFQVSLRLTADSGAGTPRQTGTVRVNGVTPIKFTLRKCS